MKLSLFGGFVAFFYAIFNGLAPLEGLILIGVTMVLLYVAVYILALLAVLVLVLVKGMTLEEVSDWLEQFVGEE